MKDLVQTILTQVKQSNLPVTISNKDYPIIEESFYIIDALENEGYKVETFSNRFNKTYGIKVS